MIHKKISVLLSTMALTTIVYAQQPPQGTSGGGAFWRQGGNIGGPGAPNIFGTATTNNNPIYTQTNGVTRMKLNGTLNYLVNGVTAPRDGFLLVGRDAPMQSGVGDLFTARGAYSLLHLNGDGSQVQDFGYRSWMRTGITLTGNKDLSYFGLRQIGANEDRTETVIAWTDNTTGIADEMAFRFMGSTISSNGATESNNYADVNDLDGLHVGRFTPNGRFGLGNSFGHIDLANSPTTHNTPQSLLHMSYQFRTGTVNQPYGFQQITYRRAFGATADIIGQGEGANDGLRLGIDNAIITTDGIQHLNGYLRWQENSPFIVQTDWDNTPGGIANGERMRITTIGAPGVVDPENFVDENITRVAISHHGTEPITNPRSLLHLGYNTSVAAFGGGQNDDGWRDWMDVGTFTNEGSDNMYVGLKKEGEDRNDAVVNWGDNQDSTLTGENGPDNLRFIFTSTTTALSGIGDPISQSNNGLETGRFYPGYDTTFTYLLANNLDLYGRFGVGDFTASGVDENPTHKLDVIGNGRFRYLPDSLYIADSLTTKYVMVDSMGVLRWTSAGPSFGTTCEDTVGGKLTFDTKVDLNNYNLYFTNNDSISKNRVGIGYECGDSLKSKLNVYSEDEQWAMDIYSNGANPVDVNSQGGLKVFVDSIETDLSIGILGEVATNNTGNDLNDAIGVFGKVDAKDIKFPIAVLGETVNGGYGGWFKSDGMDGNVATNSLRATAYNSNSGNTGAYITANSGTATNVLGSNIGLFTQSTGNSVNGNFAIRAIANGSSTGNVGIFSTSVGANNYAGYFQGNVVVTNGTLTGSDLNLKENINDLDSALQIISSLHPVKYQFKQTGDAGELSLPTEQQQGLIAQEVEAILPDFVKEVDHPVSLDEEGNVLYPSFSYKTLDYEKFVPLLIAGMQEQQVQISNLENENGTVTSYNDSLENVVSDLNDRLTNLENCLSNILQELCNANQQAVSQTPEEIQEQLRSIIDVELSDKNSIVLNQNVPNPFAERTVISYSVPSSVQRAQIHFYDMNGVLINSVDITERGEGQINVYANDLSSGIYTYSLVADGKVVSTKKMMKN